jgi:hypothetical protein
MVAIQKAMQTLAAGGPLAGLRHELDLYGRLIGDLDASVIVHEERGAKRQADGEIHFGWILEGRAIQDTWISQPLRQRDAKAPLSRSMYGTTLRIFEPGINAWRILWINPSTQTIDTMIGRQEGDDIVQLGTCADGTPIRWSFTQITPQFFHWLGERMQGSGQWRLEMEVLARRTGAPAKQSSAG